MRYLIVSFVNDLNFLNLRQLIHDVGMDVCIAYLLVISFDNY